MAAAEIIVRAERRRNWSDQDRARILAECRQPGNTVTSVAERYDVSQSLIYHWRTKERERAAAVATPLAFVDFGTIEDIGQPADEISIQKGRQPQPRRARRESTDLSSRVAAHPGNRRGLIEINLENGIELFVDAYVNERALMRVLCALKDSQARDEQIKRRMASS